MSINKSKYKKMEDLCESCIYRGTMERGRYCNIQGFYTPFTKARCCHYKGVKREETKGEKIAAWLQRRTGETVTPAMIQELTEFLTTIKI